MADAFPSPLPGPRIDVLAELVRTRGYDTVLFSNSVLAADVAAGLAARLDAGINWDLVDLELRDGQPVGQPADAPGLRGRRSGLAVCTTRGAVPPGLLRSCPVRLRAANPRSSR